jgi:hypothetical protein
LYEKRGGLCCPFILCAVENKRLISNIFLWNEDSMKKLIFIMYLMLLASGLSACSAPPKNYGNTPEQQRKNAQEAQEELSTDVNRGTR